MISVRRLRKEVRQILEEYINHQDPPLAVNSIRDLNTPHFNVEIVKKCFEIALEQNSLQYSTRSASSPQDKSKLLALLVVLEASAIVSKQEIQQALKLVTDQMADIGLDVPHAKEILTDLVKEATVLCILPTDN